MRILLEHLDHPGAMPDQAGGHQHRVQWRRLELVAERPVDLALVQKMVRINGLGRAIPAFDAVVKNGRRNQRWVQEGAAPEQLMWIGSDRTQQQRRRVDRATGDDEMSGRDAQFGAVGATVDADRPAPQGLDFSALDVEAFGAGLHQQRGTLVERGGDRRHQHRLLGIGRAAHAAGAEVPAGFDVAANQRGFDAQLQRAAPQGFVVRVRCDRPVADRKPPLDLFEPGRHRRRVEILEAEFLAPEGQCRLRRAEAAGPVDGGAAADAAALQDVDRLVGGLAAGAFLIKGRIGFGLELAEVAA